MCHNSINEQREKRVLRHSKNLNAQFDFDVVGIFVYNPYKHRDRF
jgi:hypothetical protein